MCGDEASGTSPTSKPLAPSSNMEVGRATSDRTRMDYRVLGPLKVYSGRSEVQINRARERKLLGVLLVNADLPVSIDVLIEALWDGDQPAKPEAALQTAMSRLRNALVRSDGSNPIRTGQGHYTIGLGPKELDVQRFSILVEKARDEEPADAAVTLRSALDLWRGPPYADFEYDEFAQAEIRRLNELRLAALDARITADLRLGHHDQILAELQGVVAAHPLNERMWEHLILALYRVGRQADSLRAFQDARHQLREQLGIDPGPSLRRLEEAVLRQDESINLVPASGSEVRAAEPTVTTPPAAISQLVGREDELRQLIGQIGTRRLVSVVGPAGVGKSRLVLEACNSGLDGFPDGVVWATLDRDANPPPIEEAIATAVGLQPGAEGARARLFDWARRRDQLLVLDGCEIVMPAAAVLVGDLIDACPGLTVLVASRQRLGLRSESVLWLKPLSVPSEEGDGVVDSPAVAMFLERATDHTAALEIDSDTIDAVERIVRSVDGLPLGIELAAGRLESLSVEQIADELERGSEIAASRQLSASPRHRSLDLAIACSWRTLSDESVRVVAALSVFKGPWTLDAAVGLLGEDLGEERVADLVLDMVDRSLISSTVHLGPESRASFTMLESLRRYAAERLEDLGLKDEMRRRHAYAGAAAAKRMAVVVRAQPARRERIAFAERLPDARSAHDWLLEHDPSTALRMACDIAEFCGRTQRFDLAEDWLVRSIEVANPTGAERAEALARLAFSRGQSTDIGSENISFSAPNRGWRNRHRVRSDMEAKLDAAAAGFEEAIRIYDDLGLVPQAARSRLWCAWIEAGRGDLDGAETMVTEALEVLQRSHYDMASGRLLLANIALARSDDERVVEELTFIESLQTTSEPLLMIYVLDTYGRLARANKRPAEAYQHYRRAMLEYAEPHGMAAAALFHAELGFLSVQMKDFETARAEFGSALSIGRRRGMPRIEGMVHIGQGWLKAVRGDFGAAAEYFETARLDYERLGDKEGEIYALGSRAKVEEMRQAGDVASSYALRGLAVARHCPTPLGCAQVLEVMAGVAERSGDDAVAARLMGAADAQRTSVRAFRGTNDPALGLVGRLESQLGEAATSQLLREGGGLEIGLALDLASQVGSAR